MIQNLRLCCLDTLDGSAVRIVGNSTNVTVLGNRITDLKGGGSTVNLINK